MKQLCGLCVLCGKEERCVVGILATENTEVTKRGEWNNGKKGKIEIRNGAEIPLCFLCSLWLNSDRRGVVFSHRGHKGHRGFVSRE